MMYFDSNYTYIYSTDGINWIEETNFPVYLRSIDSICYGNGKFVILGRDSRFSRPKSYAAYSTDGINWTETALPVIHSDYFQSISYEDGKFIALSTNLSIFV